MTAKKTTAQKVQAQQLNAKIKNVEMVSPDSIIDNVMELKRRATVVLDGISNEILEKGKLLKDFNDTIEAKKEELETLHEITTEANTLEEILNAQAAKTAEFEREEARKLAEANERREQRSKEWKREQEEYEYEKAKFRRLLEDRLTTDLAARRAEFDEQIKVRTEILVEREKAAQDLRDEVERYKTQLSEVRDAAEAEAAKRVAIATNSLKKDLDHKHEIELLKAQNLHAEAVNLATRFGQRVNELTAANASLQAAYEAATNKVQQIAEKAIEAGAKGAVTVNTQAGEAPLNGKR